MANIKNLRMGETICADARVSISKSLFGLRTTATYGPTNSVIDADTREYSPEDGQRIKQILSTPQGERAAAVGDFRPKKISNGNFLAEVCVSRDRKFLALQLLQFVRLNYEPVTDVLVFEGEEAAAFARLLV